MLSKRILSISLFIVSEMTENPPAKYVYIWFCWTLVVVTLALVTLWVIALGWDWFGFPVRFSPPVTLQIITQGQLLTWQYLEGNLIHHGDRKPPNIRLACGCSSVLLLIRQYPVDLAIQNFVL